MNWIEQPLIIVSNRGPASFDRDEQGERTLRRGGGGLVTALSGLVSHRKALWVASAMSDEDLVVTEENNGSPVPVEIDGIAYDVVLVGSDPEAYDRFYNVIANPILWFIQHYLWDLSNAPDIRLEEIEAWDHGYQAVNHDMANAVLQQIEGRERPLVMLHDYHLYTAPGMIRRERPDAILHHFVHIPWAQPAHAPAHRPTARSSSSRSARRRPRTTSPYESSIHRRSSCAGISPSSSTVFQCRLLR